MNGTGYPWYSKVGDDVGKCSQVRATSKPKRWGLHKNHKLDRFANVAKHLNPRNNVERQYDLWESTGVLEMLKALELGELRPLCFLIHYSS